MAIESIDTKTHTSALTFYEAEASKLKAEMDSLAQRGSPHFLAFESKFKPIISGINAIEVGPLESGAFAIAANGVFMLNAEPVLDLVAYIDADVASMAETSDVLLDPEELVDLRVRAFRLFLLHELRHVEQGLTHYPSVALVKLIAGSQYMADLDLAADCDAAAAYAAIECDKNGGGRAEYLMAFRDALFFFGNYCFPVFRFPLERTDKMSRAISLTLMAARFARAEANDQPFENAERISALDVRISTKIASDYSSMLVSIMDPHEKILKIAHEPEDSRAFEMAQAISCGDFMAAITIACTIVADIKHLA